MPTLSASDYTQYLKLKAAAISPIQPSIQTRTNATVSQSVINATVLASQASYALTPGVTVIQGNARVRGQEPNQTNNPKSLVTLSWVSGRSGSVSSTTSSKFNQVGGLPAKNVVGTYTRLPQHAGWATGSSTQATSSALRNLESSTVTIV